MKTLKLIVESLLRTYGVFGDFERQLEESPRMVLTNFKNNPNKPQQWYQIPPEQYKKALIEFLSYKQFIKFPVKYIFDWQRKIVTNTVQFYGNCFLMGNLEGELDVEIVKELFPGVNYKFSEDFLEEIGFLNTMVFPDGSPAYSDNVAYQLVELVQKLIKENTPENKIMYINMILDISHYRSDISSMFIEGGEKTMTEISNFVNPEINKRGEDIRGFRGFVSY